MCCQEFLLSFGSINKLTNVRNNKNVDNTNKCRNETVQKWITDDGDIVDSYPLTRGFEIFSHSLFSIPVVTERKAGHTWTGSGLSQGLFTLSSSCMFNVFTFYFES